LTTEADKKQVKREEQAHKLLEKRARKERRQRKMAQLREQARKERRFVVRTIDI
jgi:hypothetical protein